MTISVLRKTLCTATLACLLIPAHAARAADSISCETPPDPGRKIGRIVLNGAVGGGTVKQYDSAEKYWSAIPELASPVSITLNAPSDRSILPPALAAVQFTKDNLTQTWTYGPEMRLMFYSEPQINGGTAHVTLSIQTMRDPNKDTIEGIAYVGKWRADYGWAASDNNSSRDQWFEGSILCRML